MIKERIRKRLVTQVALVLTGVAWSVLADCYNEHPVQCATVNVTTCHLDVTCPDGTFHGGVPAVCTANAYFYPAYTCAPGEHGLDRTVGARACIFPATYLDPCTNMQKDWICPATFSYATVDYDNGQPCVGNNG